MGDTTSIAWADRTFNPWWGCVKVSPGCKNCYAETMDKRTGGSHWGPNSERRLLSQVNWSKPTRWNRTAGGVRVRSRVFSGSMCDVFEDHPTATFLRPRLWSLIRSTPHLDWLLLTKRPENIRFMLPGDWGEKGWPNVWLGTSIENMDYSDRVDALADIPAVVRFISYEPALGPLDLLSLEGIDWVIYGGESGPHHREHDQQWALDMMVRCKTEGVAFFYKQQSARDPGSIGPLDDANYIRQFPTPREGSIR